MKIYRLLIVIFTFGLLVVSGCKPGSEAGAGGSGTGYNGMNTNTNSATTNK